MTVINRNFNKTILACWIKMEVEIKHKPPAVFEWQAHGEGWQQNAGCFPNHNFHTNCWRQTACEGNQLVIEANWQLKISWSTWQDVRSSCGHVVNRYLGQHPEIEADAPPRVNVFLWKHSQSVYVNSVLNASSFSQLSKEIIWFKSNFVKSNLACFPRYGF